ncbi:hypothetical protein GCM10022255_089090 [Dactylosporangium darangshiense]|uniref:Uncharacterized protein n=1 Tax=Dactylosporangium darangshiense TaxID=579108 RepID=A0ABP8DNN5_9ACTN
MDLATALGTGSAVLGAAVTVVGLAINASSNRRAQYDRILAETAKLSQGAVASARHSVGKLLEGGPQGRVLPDETVEQIFDVLWAFERLDGLYESLRPRWIRSKRPNGPQRLLLISCRSAISTWYDYSTRAFTTASGEPAILEPSSLGVQHLQTEVQRLGLGTSRTPSARSAA